MDVITLVSTVFTGIAAVAAAIALFISSAERKSNIKKEFIIWALERLRHPEQREARALIFSLSPNDIIKIEKSIRERKPHPSLDAIRKVCFAFDEIGYFVHELKIVGFRDLLKIYPQTIKIWNITSKLVQAWRDMDDPTSFVFFEELARQERIEIKYQLEKPIKLYTKE